MRLTKHQIISRKIEVGKREVAENEGPAECDFRLPSAKVFNASPIA
jgi:hypothetical protein